MYDDLKICNAIGIFKQQDQTGGAQTMHQLETEALNQIKTNPDFVAMANNEFLLYPNPTINTVNIRYRCEIETELKIKDITGRIVQVYLLLSGDNKMTFDLVNLANGVYTYEQHMNGKIINKGKVTKQ
ncbi:MAG: T9SS type A sorting domain-containing protein [Chitinophagaceae bacterium]|nr:T9SS type A sorting domain-containing protein [Chitinophagaceae bacterium]